MEKAPSDGNSADAVMLSQPLGKDKWSQRQIKQYEVEQRMGKKKKKKRKQNNNEHHEKTDSKKRKEEKRKRRDLEI